MSKEFGQVLRKFRKYNELTQQQVADELHIDRSTYAYYERGTTEPPLVTIRKLAKLFKTSVEELLPDTENRIYARVSDVTADVRSQKSKEEEDLLNWYRNLSPEQIEEFRKFARQVKR